MVGLLGLRAQGMDGRKGSLSSALTTLVGFVDATSGSGTIITPTACQISLYGWGAGGSGDYPGIGGGGGGGAVYFATRLAANQTISYSVGASTAVVATDGGDTTITLPDGRVLTAGGGKAGIGTTGGAGGIATGGLLNRTGGNGGDATNPGGSGGQGGGQGANGSGTGGGGGGAGFGDMVIGLTGGAGGLQSTSAPGVPGGGMSGDNHTPTQGGGVGRVLILLARVSAR